MATTEEKLAALREGHPWIDSLMDAIDSITFHDSPNLVDKMLLGMSLISRNNVNDLRELSRQLLDLAATLYAEKQALERRTTAVINAWESWSPATFDRNRLPEYLVDAILALKEARKDDN